MVLALIRVRLRLRLRGFFYGGGVAGNGLLKDQDLCIQPWDWEIEHFLRPTSVSNNSY